MDIERIQKVNNLALDLMKQGLAQDKEHALVEAEKIFSGQDAEDYNELKNTISGIKESTKPEEKSEEVTEELSQDEIRNILEQNSKFLVKTIQGFQEKILTLEKELETVKSKMNYHQIPSAGEILTTKEAVQVKNGTPALGEVTDNNVNVPGSQPETTKESHPRLGRYSEEEVSVEKIFYMGNN